MASSDSLMIGFSTGALAKGDFSAALTIARRLEVRAIELSALRLIELEPLLQFARDADFAGFDYISIHAPSAFSPGSEREVASRLLKLCVEREWPTILHPDCINDVRQWTPFGALLLVENMDKRKPIGRTLEELKSILGELPEARICFDIAHARQVDSSMTEAYRILSGLHERIGQLHISEVLSNSQHDKISEAAFRSFSEVMSYVPLGVPTILETPCSDADAAPQLEKAARLLASR